METTRLNITLPVELVEELNHLVEPRKKSRFIATLLWERLKQLREKQLEKLLMEGYQARHRENQEIAQEFLNIDLEGWDEY
jgi:metal-responsive CopG/Arc/MetJ family transcriptional regulator